VRYLLDTDVVSELRRPRGSASVKAWVAGRRVEDLAISALTLAEVEIGVLRKERVDPAQGAMLRAWFEDRLLTGFQGRVLPFDQRAARFLAPMHVPDPAPSHDAIHAATALAHGLTMVTGNVADFARTGAPFTNPWTD
jgi:predicted nucleic acid-binding protein